MDQLVYALLGLYMLLVWVLCFIVRPDARKHLLKAGCVGIILGPLAEVWYFHDYWRPPGIFSERFPFFEDVLVGFAIAGIAVVIADVILGTRDAADGAHSTSLAWKKLIGFGVVGLLGLMLAAPLGVNSVVMSILSWILMALWMTARRPDLLKHVLVSALGCAAVALPAYYVLFGVLAPGYWDRYWFLAGGSLDLRLGTWMPLTELLWYVAWGAFAGIVIPYVKGARKEHIAS